MYIKGVNKLKSSSFSSESASPRAQPQSESSQGAGKQTSTLQAASSLHSPAKEMTAGKTAASKNQQQQPKPTSVPPFYFPHGRHDDKQFRSIDDLEAMRLVGAEFKTKKEGKMYKEDFADLCKLLGLPTYWKILLFRTCTNVNKLSYVTHAVFEQVWSK